MYSDDYIQYRLSIGSTKEELIAEVFKELNLLNAKAENALREQNVELHTYYYGKFADKLKAINRIINYKR